MSTRRDFLAGLGATLAAACASAPEPEPAPAKRPNILFLFPDQMRAHAMGCMGNPDVQTPHLDALAAEGMLFENTFANTPVCCPARANILTGEYASKNGMIANDLRLRESETTIAEVLAGAGYRTGFIGKWHLDGGPREPGYVPPGDRRQGFEFWAANEVSHRHFDTHYFRDTDQPIPIKVFEPEAWTDIGIEFLRQVKTDERPFFLTIQMGPPHNPYIAPEKYRALYDPEKLTMRPNWREGGERTPGREEIAHYYGMVTAIDDQVGRVLAELDTLGLAEDTIVLVSSDHGDMLGSQGARLKRKPWEESIKVPGIVRYPKAGRSGVKTDAIFTHVDFAPTLLALCGLETPPQMQGTSLAPVILGQAEDGPDSAFFQIFGPFDGGEIAAGWRGVRTKTHMYARYEDKPWLLYDLREDPYELRNLVDDPAAAEVQAQMQARLESWMQRVGDSWSLDWTEKVEDRGRLYKHEVFYTVDDYLEWAAKRPEAGK
ncbi:MAG: sulfatase [Bryobacterales bacterium]|nr:sulfatase [Bryobacterales bacterium]